MVDLTQNSNSQNEESEVVNPPSKEEQEAEVLDESEAELTFLAFYDIVRKTKK